MKEKYIQLKRRSLKDALAYLEKHKHLYPPEIYLKVVENMKKSYPPKEARGGEG